MEQESIALEITCEGVSKIDSQYAVTVANEMTRIYMEGVGSAPMASTTELNQCQDRFAQVNTQPNVPYGLLYIAIYLVFWHVWRIDILSLTLHLRSPLQYPQQGLGSKLYEKATDARDWEFKKCSIR